MRRSKRLSVGRIVLVAGIALSGSAQADFEVTGPDGRRMLLNDDGALSGSAQADLEVTGPDGRRILLKKDGTWQYLEATVKDRAEAKPEKASEAVLLLERKTERGIGCRFGVRLVNDLPYEISSLVPYYAVYRADGVIYDTVSSPSSFTGLKPGDKQSREFEVRGITCKDIARVQVVGGDQCVMGDLDKYSGEKGNCLARVRVVASDLVRFDK